MSITSAIVCYAVLWFLIMLLILPYGVQSQREAGHVEPGTPAGAPAQIRIARKMLWASIGAAVGLAAIYGVIVGGVITRADISGLAPFDMPE